MRSTDDRLIIAWDVDDVLNSLSSDWAASEGLDWESAVGSSPAQMARSCGLDDTEYLISLDRFRANSYAKLAPNPTVSEWFERYGDLSGHVVITRTPIAFVETVEAWVRLHYGDWLGGFYVTPSPRSTDASGTMYEPKSTVISRLTGVRALVDDTPENFLGIPSGISTILFPQPWNGGGPVAEALSLLSDAIVQTQPSDALRGHA